MAANARSRRPFEDAADMARLAICIAVHAIEFEASGEVIKRYGSGIPERRNRERQQQDEQSTAAFHVQITCAAIPDR